MGGGQNHSSTNENRIAEVMDSFNENRSKTSYLAFSIACATLIFLPHIYSIIEMLKAEQSVSSKINTSIKQVKGKI